MFRCEFKHEKKSQFWWQNGIPIGIIAKIKKGQITFHKICPFKFMYGAGRTNIFSFVGGMLTGHFENNDEIIGKHFYIEIWGDLARKNSNFGLNPPLSVVFM